MSREIKLTNGEITIVDDEDYEWLNQWKWYYHHSGYAIRKERLPNGARKQISMHRMILNPPEGMMIDHINRNRLDNRKNNLRMCTRNENNRNRSVLSTKLSVYKGVKYDSRYNVWIVNVGYNGTRYFCGCYSNEIVAANVYNYYAGMYHKEFSCLNDVEFIEPINFSKYRVKKGKNMYVGVTHTSRENKWYAYVTGKNKKRINIGYFDTELEAVKAYNDKVLEIYGICPKLHIIDGYDIYKLIESANSNEVIN